MIEIANVQAWSNLKADGNATISDDGSETKTMNFKRYCQDTGVELEEFVAHVNFTRDELTALRADYEAKIALVDSLIAEIG
jgi:hypothetical protein